MSWQLLGKVIRAPESNPLRSVSFAPGRWLPATDRYVRRQGRPSKEWIPEVLKLSWRIFGSMQKVEELSANAQAWNAALQIHFSI